MDTESSLQTKSDTSQVRRPRLGIAWLRGFGTFGVILVIIIIAMLCVFVFPPEVVQLAKKTTNGTLKIPDSKGTYVPTADYDIEAFNFTATISKTISKREVTEKGYRLLDYRILLQPDIFAELKRRLYNNFRLIFIDDNRYMMTGAYFDLADLKTVKFHGKNEVADLSLFRWCEDGDIDQKLKQYKEKQNNGQIAVVMNFGNEANSMCFSVLDESSEVHPIIYQPKTFPDVPPSRKTVELEGGNQVHLLGHLTFDGYSTFLKTAGKYAIPADIIKELVKPRKFNGTFGNNTNEYTYWTGAHFTLTNGDISGICCGCNTKIDELKKHFCPDVRNVKSTNANKVQIAIKIPKRETPDQEVTPCIYPVYEDLILPGKGFHLGYWVPKNYKPCSAQ